jgi:restriction endonuclease S subunit
VIEGAKTLDDDLEVDEKQLEELEAELLAALEIDSLLSADLDNLDLPESEDKELDPQVWEILLPILINFAIERIREWIKSRRRRR